MKIEVTLHLEVDVSDNALSTGSVMERVDNVISDNLTDKGDDIVTITKVWSE